MSDPRDFHCPIRIIEVRYDPNYDGPTFVIEPDAEPIAMEVAEAIRAFYAKTRKAEAAL